MITYLKQIGKRLGLIVIIFCLVNPNSFACENDTDTHVIYLDELFDLQNKTNEKWYGNFIIGSNRSIPNDREMPAFKEFQTDYDTTIWEDGNKIKWKSYTLCFFKCTASLPSTTFTEHNICHYWLAIYNKEGRIIDYCSLGISDYENFMILHVKENHIIEVEQYTLSPQSDYSRHWKMLFTKKHKTIRITSKGQIKENNKAKQEQYIAYQSKIDWSKYSFESFINLFQENSQELINDGFHDGQFDNIIDYFHVWKHIDQTDSGESPTYWTPGFRVKKGKYWLCFASKHSMEIGEPQYIGIYLLTYDFDGNLLDKCELYRIEDEDNNPAISMTTYLNTIKITQKEESIEKVTHYTISDNGKIIIVHY